MSDQITISKEETITIPYKEYEAMRSIMQELANQISALELEVHKLKQNKKEELSITTQKPRKIILQNLKVDDTEDDEDSELNAYVDRAVDLLLKYGKEVL